MAHEMQTPYTPPAAHEARRPGLITFAAVMFFAAGGLDILWGISALVNDKYFAVDELLFGDLSMWGVLYLIFGGIQLLTGWLILSRSAFGAVLGIGLALLHALMVLMSIGAYPIWSIVLLAIDGLILYGLAAHGFGADDA